MSHFAKKTIAADLSLLPQAINFVTSCIFPPIQDVWKVELAVEEAIANIVEHGYRYQSGSIDIECTVTPTNFVVCLKDTSWAFNPAAYDSSNQDALSERGRGILLIRAVTDGLEYSREGTINTLTLKKQR